MDEGCDPAVLTLCPTWASQLELLPPTKAATAVVVMRKTVRHWTESTSFLPHGKLQRDNFRWGPQHSSICAFTLTCGLIRTRCKQTHLPQSHTMSAPSLLSDVLSLGHFLHCPLQSRNDPTTSAALGPFASATFDTANISETRGGGEKERDKELS